ncbi:MAG: prepilin-type N-terminal cleavage/methylation domain-containing protein [Phycisphaerales bacterium]
MPGRPGTSSNRVAGPAGGFTLIELIVTAAIIAVVAAVAVPQFAAASARYRLDLATQRVLSDLSIVAGAASAAGTSRSVVFDAPSDSYIMLGIASQGRAFNRWVDLGPEPFKTDLVSATFTDAVMLKMSGHGVAENDGLIIIASGLEAKRITLTQGSPTIGIETLTISDPPRNTGTITPVEVRSTRSVDVAGSAATDARFTR